MQKIMLSQNFLKKNYIGVWNEGLLVKYSKQKKRLNKKFDEDVATDVLWNYYLNNELLNRYYGIKESF